MPTKTRGIYRPRARVYYVGFAKQLLVIENDRAWVNGARIKKMAVPAVKWIAKHASTFVGYV